MIDREQVLHIARLARLRLDEEEVERMAQELSGILEHVETIGSLDLDGVEPTTHVVALENVMRPKSSVFCGPVGSSFSGASLTGASVIVRVSTSVSGPPAPVLPLSVVVMTRMSVPEVLVGAE